MERDHLVDVWITEGLLDFIEDRSEQLSMGHTIIDQLESACLLEPSTVYGKINVAMHDLMREMAIRIHKKDAPFLVKSGVQLKIFPRKELEYKDLVKVSLTDCNIMEIPHDMSPETPNLIALCLCGNEHLLEIPELFFVHMKSLKILDLSRTGIKRLPDSVSELEDLRALYLDECLFLEYVPSVEKLTKLRVLGLPKSPNLEMPKGVEGLECLEKLPHYILKFSDVDHFRSAQSLTHYVLHIHDPEGPFGMTLDWSKFEPYPWKRKINIYGLKLGDGQQFPTIPPTAESVSCHLVIQSKHKNLVDKLSSLAGVTELKYLDLYYCRGFEFITTSASSCPQLDTLWNIRLSYLDGLKRITKHGAFSFSNLTEVSIQDCDLLEVGLPVKSAHHHHHMHPLLPNLQGIFVTKCPKLKEMFELTTTASSLSEIGGSNFNPILVLPKLIHMELYYLPKLHSICRGLLLCPFLRHKSVKKCPKLNLLPLCKCLICDTTLVTWASIPQQDDDPKWWDPLRRHHPEDAVLLSSFKVSVSKNRKRKDFG